MWGPSLTLFPATVSKPIDWCLFLGQARELFQAMCVCDAKVQWRATSYRWQFLEGTGMFLAILEIDHPILVPDGFGGDPWFHYSTKQTKQTEWHSSKFLIVHLPTVPVEQFQHLLQPRYMLFDYDEKGTPNTGIERYPYNYIVIIHSHSRSCSHGIVLVTHTHRYNIHTYMHPYIHTSIHPSIHTFIHPSIHTYIHTYLPTYLPTHTHTYIHTYIHTYLPTCLPACLHTCMHAYIHTYRQTYRHTHRYIYMYIIYHIIYHTHTYIYIHTYAYR